MWIVRLALRRPYTIAVLCFFLSIFGFLSTKRMQADIFPKIDIPVVLIVWSYPGLPADEVERRITFITERACSSTVNGISRIESQAQSGISLSKVYFEPGTDIGASIAQIAAVTNTVRGFMPTGMQPPNIIQFNASSVPVSQIILSSDTASEQQLYDYGINFLRLSLFTIPGLAVPAPFGGKSRQIMVDVDPKAAAGYGLTPQDVVEKLLGANLTIPAGSVRIGEKELDVALNNSPDVIADFNRIPMKVEGSRPVYLGDIATVHDGFAVQNNIVRVDGKRATYLTLIKKADASTLAVVDASKDMLPALQKAAPEGIKLELAFDQSVFVRNSISGVLHEALVSSVLVSVMILLFLGSVRSVIIVCTSIPLAMAVALIGLFATGQSLNAMTLGGLSLAIGMLVDDATVTIENIHRHRHLGKPLTVAILDGAEEISIPALAATLTICIVFFPVVFLEGPAKFLFIALALSVVFAMIASYMLSRTLVPSLTRLLLVKEKIHFSPNDQMTWGRRYNQRRDQVLDRLTEAYGALLSVVLRARAFVLVVCGVLVVFAGLLATRLGTDFFPSVDAGQMKLHVRAPAGTRIEETERYVGLVEGIAREVIPSDELKGINDNIGVPVSYNLAFVQSDNVGGQDADIAVQLTAEHAPTALYQKQIRERIRKELPELVAYFQPADIISQVLNFGLPAPLDIQVEARDMEAGAAMAMRIRDQLGRVPGIVDLRIAQAFHHPAFKLTVDRERAAQLGLSQRDVANNMITSMSSSQLVSPNFWVNPENGVQYPVVVQTPQKDLASTSELMATPIGKTAAPTATWQLSPSNPQVSSVARISPTETRSSINHYTVQRVVDVQANVEDRDLGAVKADIDKVIADLGPLPAGMKVTLRGQAESMTSSFASLGFGMIFASVLVYLLLVVLFQSFLDPFIIMAAVPGALLGVVAFLAVTGTTLNVESLMGAIMSIGVAVSNSILLVSYANEVRSKTKCSALAGALEAGKTRLRPVLMTALAMILGMIPMAIGAGEGGEQNAPLGRSVIGGLLVATFVTLFVIPTIYSLLRKGLPTGAQLDARFEAEAAGEDPAAPHEEPALGTAQ